MLEPQDPPVYRAKAGMPLWPQGDPRNDAWDAKDEIPSAAKVMAEQP